MFIVGVYFTIKRGKLFFIPQPCEQLYGQLINVLLCFLYILVLLKVKKIYSYPFYIKKIQMFINLMIFTYDLYNVHMLVV